MMIVIGSVLLLIGLTSGSLLLALALGITGTPGWLVWLLFPLATLGGHLAIGLGQQPTVTRLAALLAGGASLALALASTVLVFAHSAGLMTLPGESAGLWVLTGVGFMQGGLLWSLGMRMGGDKPSSSD